MEEHVGLIEFKVDKNQKPLGTIGNCVLAFKKDPRFLDMFRYNLLTDHIEITKNWWKRSALSLSDTDINYIRFYLETQYSLSSEKAIPRAIDIIAHQNTYHPIREVLESLKWDGVHRICELLPKYLGAARDAYTAAATKLFFMGALCRIFEPGCKFDTMICLVEDRQGGGKSTIARFLAMQDEWFSDDIKNLDDENIYRKLQGHWILEFSEMLATTRAKDVESIKSFMSRQKDTYKPPYDKYPRDYPRQCVFIGTTNNLQFLPNDVTGNRRFIPVPLNSREAEVHPLTDETETRDYIKQCWAEAMEIYRSGDYTLTFPRDLEDQLAEIRRQSSQEDPNVGIIQEWLDKCNYKFVCSIMIYKEALGNEYQAPKAWELKEINGIMAHKIEGWEKISSTHRFKGYGIQRGWKKREICIPCDSFSVNEFQNIPKQLKIPFPDSH